MRISNNAWGAVVQTVKAIAALQGWEVRTNRSVLNFIRDVGVQTGDTMLGLATENIHDTHHLNFYQDYTTPSKVKRAPQDAALLINRLWNLEPSIRGKPRLNGAKEMKQERQFKRIHTEESIMAVAARHQRQSRRETLKTLINTPEILVTDPIEIRPLRNRYWPR